MEAIFASPLFEKLLIDPPRDYGVDRLDVVSGYATPSMVAQHMARLDREPLSQRISVDLTVGMTASEGLRLDYHRGFQKLANESTTSHSGPGFDFSCGYRMADGPAIHSKVYVWSKHAEPLVAFAGSANYSQVGMGIARAEERQEVMCRVDPTSALEYVRAVAADRIEVNDPDVHAEIVLYRALTKSKPDLGSETDDDQSLVQPRVPQFDEHVSLTLLSSQTGKVHNPGGGLNHGQRASRSNKNEAYIPVPINVQRSGFFPPVGKHFLVSTDDGKVLIMSTGSGELGKDLRTPLRNGDLGEYLRYRMGISNGAAFTDEAFAAYGRTSVDFFRVDDETYFMDFSRP